MIIIRIIFLILSTFKIIAFNTLEDAQLYAQFYTKEDLNLEAFTNTYEKLSKCNKIISKEKLWSSKKFDDLIKEIYLNRQLSGYYEDFIIRINPICKSKFIIFGQLNSSFHSFIRDLTYLLEIGIIDNNYKILKPNFFIIILGAIGGKQYILETLTLILNLMKQNPNSVFYLKEKPMLNNNWINQYIKKEFKLKAKNTIINHPLKITFNRFFSTLPYSLYITPNPNQGVIRLSNFGFNYKKIKEKNFKRELTNLQVNTVKKLDLNTILYNQNNSKKHDNSYSYIQAIIKNQNILRNNEAIKGLNFLTPKEGAIKWHIFSAPNKFYQKYFNAHYDSFCLIKTGLNIKDSTISVYNRDITSSKAFLKYKTYNIVTTKLLNSNNHELPQNQIIKKNNNLNHEEIEEILLKIRNISQKIYALENKFNNYLFKINSDNLFIKQIREYNE